MSSKNSNTNITTSIIEPINKYCNDEISLVFAADDNYAPYLSVTIQSILEHQSSHNNFYSIYILNSALSQDNKNRLNTLQTNKLRIQYININPYIENYDQNIFQIPKNLSITTYYRFFIPEIFKKFDKILYLDCDGIFLEDVAKLYNIDIDDKAVGAIRDFGVLVEAFEKDSFNYFYDKLGIENIHNYFNAGVLLFNMQEIIKFNYTESCIKTLQNLDNIKWGDQDVLNIVLKNKVKYIDNRWNVLNNVVFPNSYPTDLFTNDIINMYNSSVNNPKFLHYAGVFKPWDNPASYRAELFWDLAKFSPFFGKLMSDCFRRTNNILINLINQINNK